MPPIIHRKRKVSPEQSRKTLRSLMLAGVAFFLVHTLGVVFGLTGPALLVLDVIPTLIVVAVLYNATAQDKLK